MLINNPFRRIYRFLANQHDYLNAICEDNRKHYLKLGINKEKITRIPNGINLSKFSESKYPSKIRKFVFLGRLIKLKGIRELLPAFAKAILIEKNISLQIIGDGPERKFIEDYITKNHLSNSIKLIGPINPDVTRKYLCDSDCLILPSHTEGFPLVVLEAAASKRAIVVSDISDIKKYFKGSVVYTKAGDIESITEGIIKMISEYNSKNCDYANIIKKFEIGDISKKISTLFQRGKTT